MKQDISTIIVSVSAAIVYLFTMIAYELWLWKRAMNDFRNWLGKKLGYSIKAVAGFRWISWEIDPKAPAKAKICVMIVSNVFIILTGLVPILILAIIALVMFLVDYLMN